MKHLLITFALTALFAGTTWANDGGTVTSPPSTDAGVPDEWLTGESCEFGVYQHMCEGDILHSCIEESEEDMENEDSEAFEVISNCAAWGATCGQGPDCVMASGESCPFWDETRCVVSKNGGDCRFFEEEEENLTQIFCEQGGSCVLSFNFATETGTDVCQPAIGTCFVGGEPRFCTADNYLAFCMQMENLFALVDPLGFNCNSMGVTCGLNEYGEQGCIWGLGEPCHVDPEDDSHILACAEGLVCNGYVEGVTPGVCEPVETESLDAGTSDSDSNTAVADAGNTASESDGPLTPATQGCGCNSHNTSNTSAWGILFAALVGLYRRRSY